MIPCKGLEENDFLSVSTGALPGAQGLSPMKVMNLCFRRGNMGSHLIVKELSSSSPQHCQRNNRNPGHAFWPSSQHKLTDQPSWVLLLYPRLLKATPSGDTVATLELVQCELPVETLPKYQTPPVAVPSETGSGSPGRGFRKNAPGWCGDRGGREQREGLESG